MALEPAFRAGGLASGIDTNSLIDQLVKIQGRPIELLRIRQAGIRAQVSALGDIISKLSSLESAARKLGDDGSVATKVTSSHTGFDAVSSSNAFPSSYPIKVNTLAVASHWRSTSFASATAPVAESKYDITVDGTTYNLDIVAGTPLNDVVDQIRSLGVPVNAFIIDNGSGNFYLELAAQETGTGVLSVALDPGSPGDPLLLTEIQPGVDASLTFDYPGAANDITFTRKSNVITDVVPGTTLTLKEVTTSPETLIIENDIDGTVETLQEFVDAYNAVMGLIQKHLAVTKDTDRNFTLAGDSAVRSLQRRLRELVTAEVGTSDIDSLAGIGITSARDGTLSIDRDVLETALTQDSQAVNALFSTQTEGLADLADDLKDDFTHAIDGSLTQRKKSLSTQILDIDDDIANLQLRLDKFRESLIQQFTSMEKLVSSFRSVGDFLSRQSFGGFK